MTKQIQLTDSGRHKNVQRILRHDHVQSAIEIAAFQLCVPNVGVRLSQHTRTYTQTLNG